MSKPTGGFGVSDRVHHSMYGPGTISEIQHGFTVIDFDENGRRKFVSSMVQLAPTDIAAPQAAPKKARAKAAKAGK